MPEPATALQRVGHGRWNVIMKPTPGTLWVTDTGDIGFFHGPRMDPDAVNTLIQNALDAGKDGNTAFDELIVAIGGPSTKTGELGHWREDYVPVEIPRLQR